ncbi:MAG TPA: DEAD/DEAH box helicase, partial [Vicinamibacterales bacterium]|nr:DEAD/DEAH box helicase [Vicinamibacterales bacterium]
SLLQGMKDMGYLETRPVQSAVIPYALAGDDVLASAETGSGKTIAFVLPILHRLFNVPDQQLAGTRALILAPTRELAVQIEDTIQGLTYHTKITSAAVYGGVPMEPQDRALRAGVSIVVATPGRLMDHMRSATPDFGRLEVLVLDEADRMMDMGFWPDVQRIVGTLPAERQTLLFSATLPDEIMKLAKAIVRPEARHIQVGRAGGPALSIRHIVHAMAASEKVSWLAKFLRGVHGPTLVFLRRKSGADRVARDLARLGIKATALHGDRSQGERTAAVEGFRSGKYTVLVATDLAARGLDIDGITYVVNFEVPDTPESYVHRVGRTGRDRADGTAVTLVSPEEERAFRALEKSVGVQLQ